MSLRIVVIVTVFALVLFAQVQATQVGGPREHASGTLAGLLDLDSVVIADNHADGDNADNDDGDNGDADNDDGDNGDNDGSTTSDSNPDIVIENVSPSAPAAAAPAATPSPGPAASAASPAAPAAAPSPAAAPVTEASGTSTGGDSTFALPDNRIAVQVFASMPAGITLTVRLIDPVTVPAAPGLRVGDLIFVLEARDSAGVALTTLPAEVNVTLFYTDRETGGLPDDAVTLSWLDPVSSQWVASPKIVTDPAANVVSASLINTGTYVVSIP